MAYDAKTRNKNEKAALAEIKKVLKGKGQRKGVFYVAINANAPLGQQASVVVNSFARDKAGTKTLSAGKKMKTSMGATNMMRGLIEVNGSQVVLAVLSKKGNARLMKKLLWQDLAERAKGGKNNDKPTAKNLLLIFKKAKVQDGTGSPDEALDAEEHGEEVEAALSPEDMAALGIDPDEAAELDTLEAHFASKMDEMTDVLGDILGSDDTDGDQDDEMLQKAALAELNGLKSKLASYASMSETDKTMVLKAVQAQIDLIGSKSSGDNPFPDELGDVIPATEAILTEVALATERYLVGDRTMGMETEYVRAPVYNKGVWGSACPTCGVKAYKGCDKENEDEELVGNVHTSRAAGGLISDHTTIFTMHLNDKSGKTLLCQWDYETQGRGDNWVGTLEAVTQPFKLSTPSTAPEDALELKQTQQSIYDAIDLVQTSLKANLDAKTLVRKVKGGLKSKKLAFAKADSCPDNLVFQANPGRAPQITFSTSLAGFHETCMSGFPEGVHGDRLRVSNNFQLKAAALDGDDLYKAVVGAISDDTDGDAPHRAALASGKIGPKLKGFATVVGAWAASLALGQDTEPVDPDKPEGWEKAKIMPHPSMVKPPQGDDESDHDFQERLKAAAMEKSFYWMKDMYAIMPKVPMAFLAQDGGLTREELALCRAKEDEFVAAVGVILARYGVDLSMASGTGSDMEDYIRDTVLNGKPAKGDDESEEDFLKRHEQWREQTGDDWASTTGSALGHDITHRDKDDSLRMVTEVRMCSGKHSSRDLAERMAQKLAESDQKLVQGALTEVFT